MHTCFLNTAMCILSLMVENIPCFFPSGVRGVCVGCLIRVGIPSAVLNDGNLRSMIWLNENADDVSQYINSPWQEQIQSSEQLQNLHKQSYRWEGGCDRDEENGHCSEKHFHLLSLRISHPSLSPKLHNFEACTQCMSVSGKNTYGVKREQDSGIYRHIQSFKKYIHAQR